VSRLSLPNTNDRRAAGFFLAAALFFVSLFGQAGADAGNGWLDENLVRQAMRREAFRLLVQKIDAVHDAATVGFDYHIEQAYEKIRNRLPADALSASELEAWLQQFLPNRDDVAADSEFQTLISDYIKGMSLEIVTTLQFECEQAEDLVARLGKLADALGKAPRPGRDALERQIRQADLGRKMSGIITHIDRDWRQPHAAADSFSIFSVLKKNMTGQNADKDLRLVFDLGDRYQSRYPFLDGFMENYRSLAEAFRRTAQGINASLGANPAELGKSLR